MLSFNWTPGGLSHSQSNINSSGSTDEGLSNKSTKQPSISSTTKPVDTGSCDDSLSSEINFGEFIDWDNHSLQIAPGAVVCVEAEVKGDVKIGTKTIVHPCAKILATGGPIIIGESNIIEELVIIENRSPEPLLIGKNNTFEVGAIVLAAGVGDSNVFETKCLVAEGVRVGNGCVFGAGIKITPPTSVVDNSVFYGEPLKYRISGEKPASQTLQIDFLGRILPNYHHVKNPAK